MIQELLLRVTNAASLDDLGVNSLEGDAEALCERSHEPIFFLRLFPQSVVDMEDYKAFCGVFLLAAFREEECEGN